MVNLDPGTLEIQSKPETFFNLRRYTSTLQSLIFDAARMVGMYPNYQSSTHIHLSILKFFGEDVIAFRNFIVDYVSHPELATGVFEYDHRNAPPLNALDPELYEVFKQIIRDFDADPSRYTIKSLAKRLVDEVFNQNPLKWLPYRKYQAMSLLRIIDDRFKPEEWTIQIRAGRGVVSFRQLLLFLEVYVHRVQFLKNKGLVPLLEKLPSVEVIARQAESRFKKYIEEMRLSWKKYREIVFDRDPNTGPDVTNKSYFMKLLKTLEPEEQARSCLILTGLKGKKIPK